MPFFSIIIPSYNRADRIKATIDSVLAQTFQDWELIIVDDGSTDNTSEVIESIKDDRIKYFKKENGERGAARNYGAEKASGQYFNFFDSDDLMKLNHLELAADYLEKYKETQILCFPWEYCNSKGEVIDKRTDFDQNLNEIIKNKNFIHLNGGFIEASCFEKNKFEEDREFKICEDWFFYLKLSLGNKIHGVNTPTFKYILHEDSTMNNMELKSFEVAIKYFTDLISKNESLKANQRNILQELYSMASLAAAVEGLKSKSIHYFYKSFKKKPGSLFSKRTLGIFKNLLNAKRRSRMDKK